jgi:Predicted membrane protein (DUF2207) C-terminal domain
MSAASNTSAFTYAPLWYVLTFILAYYVVMAIVFRWKLHRDITVTRYEPPKGISPAVAAYLLENGRCERAFAAALVSLAVKGFLGIQQKNDWFSLQKLRAVDESLTPEESTVLVTLFPIHLETYSFDNLEYGRLYHAYGEFEDIVETIVEPELISTHFVVWLLGAALSLAWSMLFIPSFPLFEGGRTVGSIAFESIWLILGGSCLVAAFRVWPITLRKLFSLLPGRNRPRLPLDLNDIAPLVLTSSALIGFGFLASATSSEFGLFVFAWVIVVALSRRILHAPTLAGRRVLAELEGFREFVARADSDRMNSENQPGHSPQILEKNSAYALAFGIEHGWGEEMAQDLFALIQMEAAYNRWPRHFLNTGSGPVVLKLDNRK